MSLKPGQWIGGIRTVEDVRQRCFIDADGCWIWRGCSSGGAPSAKIGSRYWKVRRWACIQTRTKAGKPMPAGRWQTACACAKPQCVSPRCAMPLEPKAFAAWLRDAGFVNTPAHKAACAEAMRKIAPKLDARKAVECAARILAGETSAKVAASLGISQSYACKVANGGAWAPYTRSLRP